jgi:hypothetical protein
MTVHSAKDIHESMRQQIRRVLAFFVEHKRDARAVVLECVTDNLHGLRWPIVYTEQDLDIPDRAAQRLVLRAYDDASAHREPKVQYALTFTNRADVLKTGNPGGGERLLLLCDRDDCAELLKALREHDLPLPCKRECQCGCGQCSRAEPAVEVAPATLREFLERLRRHMEKGAPRAGRFVRIEWSSDVQKQELVMGVHGDIDELARMVEFDDRLAVLLARDCESGEFLGGFEYLPKAP